ncbi:MAG: hypothetical protein LBC78_04595 [Oscillospiraceae bacterium]|nr:hypothetical protein [Oscillospiraceae bacterium]
MTADAEKSTPINEVAPAQNERVNMRQTHGKSNGRSSYEPQNIDEYSKKIEADNAAQTDKTSRKILWMCLSLLAAVVVGEAVLGILKIPIESKRIDTVLDTVKYITSTVMGYLFGKGALSGKK